MKSYITFGAILASALTLSACNQNKDAGNGAKAANSSAPAPAPASTTNAAAPAAGQSAAGADATNQNFTIRNRTGQAIQELYVSAVSTDEWEEDVLGQDTLPNGESVNVRFERAETQCNWDLRVVFEGGQALEERNVNLCQTGEIEIAP